MENPTLERMEAWRDQATERLSLFARSNAIEEPIGIGEECYQLGEDCYKPDRYDQFRWVTEDQFDSVLPPGIEHDRYIAMTNMTGFDDEIKEWSANWNDPGYWHDAAADALWSSNDGAYWTTRDEDPSDAVMARATAASQIALELDADNLIERTPENIGLLHDIVDTVHGMDRKATSDTIAPTVRNRPRNRRRASHRWRDRGENHVRRMEPRQGPVSEGQQGRRLGRHGPDHRGPARMGQPYADPGKRRRIRGRHAGRPH